jgi:glycosyltransferase involved in cell wall biosynthesis
MMSDLFQGLSSEADATLFRARGATGRGERGVPYLSLPAALTRRLPLRVRHAAAVLELRSFAARVWRELAGGHFDVVHFIDQSLARPLALRRSRSGERFRLVFTDGGPAPQSIARWVDHIHSVTPMAREALLEGGIAPDDVTAIPVGIDLDAFPVRVERTALRRSQGVAEDEFLILSVTSVNRHHKRVDYLFEEVGRVEGPLLLWVDGAVRPDGDPRLLELGRRQLGERLRHTHVDSRLVGELYGMADVVVLASLEEAFGLAVVEAICSGAPVLTHDSPHFRWLVGGAGFHVNMREPGALAAALERMRQRPEELRAAVAPEAARSRFGWKHLVPRYLDMYSRLPSLQAGSIRS